jgi:TatD DNase family protein
MNKLIDSHFHTLCMKDKGMDTDSLLKSLFAAGFSGGIDIGLDPGDMSERYALLNAFPGIRLAGGIYPGFAQDMKKGAPLGPELDKLIKDIETFHPAAVGEIGLDWYWDYGTRSLQKELLRAQIEIANQFDLPIIIHNRDADSDIVKQLTELPSRAGGIIHCFSADWESAEKLLDLGYMISFAGNITYRNNHTLREVLKNVPADRLLLETDSPYLAPVPVRGKLNSPGNMEYIYRTAAEVCGTDFVKLTEQIEKNLRIILGEI